MKQTIIRKDGITYERKQKEPPKYTRCLCLRIEEDTFEKLKQYDKPSKIIRNLINDFLDKEIK